MGLRLPRAGAGGGWNSCFRLIFGPDSLANANPIVNVRRVRNMEDLMLVAHVTLVVGDYDEALTFYVGKLALQLHIR